MPQKTSPSLTARPLAVALVLAGAITLPATRALAISAVSNLGETTFGAFGVDNFNPGWIAVSFLTGPVAMTLDSVDLRASFEPFLPLSTGYTVSLAADPDAIFGGSPGGVLAPLSGSDLGAPADYNYLAPANLVLDPATPYWIIASVDSQQPQSGFRWEVSGSTAETGLAGWSIADAMAYSFDSGQSWPAEFPFVPQFQVNVSAVEAVPEPSTYAAGGAVALMLAAAWRRQRQQRQPQG